MLTESRVRTLEQIKSAGFAHFHPRMREFSVNGWKGKRNTAFGPQYRTMKALIDGAFLAQVKSCNEYVDQYELTVFGIIAIDTWREKHPRPDNLPENPAYPVDIPSYRDNV